MDTRDREMLMDAIAALQQKNSELQAERARLMPVLERANGALKKAYKLLMMANLKERPEENQRCGRCDYCEALLSNADDDECGECYGIVKALAAINEVLKG